MLNLPEIKDNKKKKSVLISTDKNRFFSFLSFEKCYCHHFHFFPFASVHTHTIFFIFKYTFKTSKNK